MGANDRQTFFKVVLPAASPWIITAMKVSVPFALVGAIVGEFMAATAGLGFKIQLYTAQFDTTGAVTGVLVLMSWSSCSTPPSIASKRSAALAPGQRAAGSSEVQMIGDFSMTEHAAAKNVSIAACSALPPQLHARHATLRRRACNRARARADQGEDHAALGKPELHADLCWARQGLLQGGRHRPPAGRHARRRSGRTGPDGEGGRVRGDAAASPLHALSAEPEAARRCGILGRCGINMVISKEAAAERRCRRDSPFEKKLAALKGLTFGVSTPGSLTYNMGLYYILRAGLKPQDDAKVVGTGVGTAALAAMKNKIANASMFPSPTADEAVHRGFAAMADQQHPRPGPRSQGVPARRDLRAARISSERTPTSASAWSGRW